MTLISATLIFCAGMLTARIWMQLAGWHKRNGNGS